MTDHDAATDLTSAVQAARAGWLRLLCRLMGHRWHTRTDDHRDHVHMDGVTIAVVTYYTRSCARCGSSSPWTEATR